MTCAPWKPVVKKNVLPNTESDIVKGQETYSCTWIRTKENPREMVEKKPHHLSKGSEFSRAQCAHVMVQPLDRSKIVLSRGNEKG